MRVIKINDGYDPRLADYVGVRDDRILIAIGYQCITKPPSTLMVCPVT